MSTLPSVARKSDEILRFSSSTIEVIEIGNMNEHGILAIHTIATGTMRYEKSQALLRLANELQGTAEGLSLRDIQEKFSVSRRTAERMRDAVCEVFPDVEEVLLGDGFKRWRIRLRRSGAVAPITVDELTTLHAAAARLRQEGLKDQADVVDGVEAKLRSMLLPNVLVRLGADYEALLESQGLAMRPGPRPRIAGLVMRDLREAIKGAWPVTLHYRARETGAHSRLLVHPYGFIYGNRHYLVGFHASPDIEAIRLFSLANIEKVERAEGQFTRDPNFSLDAYAANSFGVFQEEPFNVVWRVSPEAADDAREHLFHPSQTFEDQPDGSLLVRFKAGGLLEMCWHLFTWGGAIQVVEPQELIDVMREQLENLGAAALQSAAE